MAGQVIRITDVKPTPSSESEEVVRVPIQFVAIPVSDLERFRVENAAQREYQWKQVLSSGEPRSEFIVSDDVRDNYRDRWLDEKLSRIDQKVEFQAKIVDEKLNAYNAKLDQFLGEIRGRDDQRHQESVAIQQTLSSLQASNRQIIIAIVLGFVSVAAAVLIGLLVPHFYGGS